MTLCYFDVEIGGKPIDRIVMRMYDDITPITCKNFVELCKGNDGKKVPGTEIPMHYKGCSFHRVIKSFMLQGGDFTNHNGTGGHSIYGDNFEDENFEKPCDRPGLLAMANRGPATNSSQFFITTTSTATHLTGKHVVFGEVVGAVSMNAVRTIEHTPTGEQDVPKKKCIIVDCGTLESYEAPKPDDGDEYPDYVEDMVSPSSPGGTAPGEDSVSADEHKVLIAEEVRQIGNKAFGAGNLATAINKYEKALRYLSAAFPNSATAADIDSKKVACYSNSALCFIKQKQFAEAHAAANSAVAIDGKNAKAMFRRGQAAAGLGNWEAAEGDFRRCLNIDPENVDAQNSLAHAVEQQRAAKEKLKKNLAKMFE